MCSWIEATTHIGPPSPNGVYCKLCCITRSSDIDISEVSLHIVYSIRNSTTHGLAGKVIMVNLFRIIIAPGLSFSHEIPNQLLLLGVNANDRKACVEELLLLPGDVGKLLIHPWVPTVVSLPPFQVTFE